MFKILQKKKKIPFEVCRKAQNFKTLLPAFPSSAE